MEAGTLIWVLAGGALLLALAAVTMSYLSWSEVRLMRKTTEDHLGNVGARLTGVEGHVATIVKNLPTGPALVPTFTAPGPSSSESVEPVYPTPPEGPRLTALPSAHRPTRRG